MVDTLVRSDQDIDANLASLSKFGRFWLLAVAAVDVLLVILSLVVLSAVLAIAAVLVAVWAPGRDGRQLPFVRRLTARSSGDDELGGAMPEHHDRGVGTAAGDGRQDRTVDDP